METCPCCGRYMRFNMAYFCGNPSIYYTCTCGYDTRNQINTVTSVMANKTDKEK